MRLLRQLILMALVAGLFVAPATQAADPLSAGTGGGSCAGEFYNPIKDTNWTNLFPITVSGIPLGAVSNPPTMYMPPICVCPNALGVPVPGVGITYWEPNYIAEVAKTAGCFSTLGGASLLGSSYSMLNSEQDPGEHGKKDAVTRMQVHWYEYPLFDIVGIFTDLACRNRGGFAIGYFTEIDPLHQNDLWGAVLSPEGSLFANTVAALACSADAVASSFAYPLEPLFWCAGTAGSVYPLTGNSNTYVSPQTGNMHILGKFLAKMHRVGMLLGTTTPAAMCSSFPAPIWIKSQYRINPIWPTPIKGAPIYMGKSEFLWGGFLANFPTREDSAYLIWQGKQCCLRL